MDCPSEESLIRLQLGDVPGVKSLQFDLPSRQLEVIHANSPKEVFSALEQLNLGAAIIKQTTISADFAFDHPETQSRLLKQVLFINLFFFILELIAGLLSQSIGLVADGLDMLADTFVYALALAAVGGSMLKKDRIASLSGYLQLALALIGLTEVVWRFIGKTTAPDPASMILISILALIGNVSCLLLLQKNKSNESHMKASLIFTSNDVIANAGIILAGALVYFSKSRYPDLIVGAIVFLLVVQGAIRILKLSNPKRSGAE